MSESDPAALFDNPAEKQIRQYKAAKARVQQVLTAPEWGVLVEFLQMRFRDRLSTVLFGDPGPELEAARADARAVLALGTEFGTADLRVDGQLLNLERMIADSRQSLAAQLGIPEGEQDAQR